MFSIGFCGHFAPSTLLETWSKETVFETNIKTNYVTKNAKIQKCKMWHRKQKSYHIWILFCIDYHYYWYSLGFLLLFQKKCVFPMLFNSYCKKDLYFQWFCILSDGLAGGASFWQESPTELVLLVLLVFSTFFATFAKRLIFPMLFNRFCKKDWYFQWFCILSDVWGLLLTRVSHRIGIIGIIGILNDFSYFCGTIGISNVLNYLLQ